VAAGPWMYHCQGAISLLNDHLSKLPADPGQSFGFQKHQVASEHTDDGARVEEAVPDDGGLSRRDEHGESGKGGLEHDGRMRVMVGRWPEVR
jgi:hypothetical protein